MRYWRKILHIKTTDCLEEITPLYIYSQFTLNPLINNRLRGAYILARFAVQRERIEGLAVFSKVFAKTLEQVDVMTNWKC